MNNYMKIIINALKQWGDENLAAFDAKILNKVDKVNGKGLSTNDFTNEDKNKLNSITIPLSDNFIPDNIARKADVSKEITEAIEKIPEVKVPVTSVNGQTGDVVIEIPEQKDITVNGVSPDESGNIQIEIGSGGVSSWNDLTDKPFYEDVSQTTIFNAEDLAFTSNSGLCMASISEELKLTIGNTYVIDWDGTEYQCEATYYEPADSVLLGNSSIAGLEGDTGEPFWFNIMSSRVIIASNESKNIHSIKIYSYVSEVKTLDEKFVSEDIARVSDVFCYKKNTHHVIEWDGNSVDDNNVIRDNLAIDYHGQRLYKVSEFTPLATDFTSYILVTWSTGYTSTYTVDEFSKNADRLYNTNILIVYTADKELNEDPNGFSAIAPSTGLYLLMNKDGDYVSKIEFDAITVQQLDDEYIPDTIARKSDITSGSSFIITMTSVDSSSSTDHVDGDSVSGSLEIDKSYDEILNAYELGRNMWFNFVADGNYMLHLSRFENGRFLFSDVHTVNSDSWNKTLEIITVQVVISSGATSFKYSIRNLITDSRNILSLPNESSVGQVLSIDSVYTNGEYQCYTYKAVDLPTTDNSPKSELILNSSTDGSTKQFKITIDDSGTLTIAEIVKEVE